MITTGVTGGRWRASISASGGVHPWDDERVLGWYVAADDRWHRPASEPTVRQRRIEGSPVTETRVRVPNGDVVQRIYSVADADGITVVEVENESTMAVAIAFDRRDVLTERPIADIPIEGIDLGAEAFVLPLGHTATLRIGLPHTAGSSDAREGILPGHLPTAAQVARGWQSVTDRASRLVLPDGEHGAALAEQVRAQRCELALGAIPNAGDDAAGYAIALGELVRMGEQPSHWLPELVEAVERLGPRAGWEADVALVAADRVLAIADEQRARRDLRRIVDQRERSTRPAAVPAGVALVPWLETQLARGGELLPDGLPSDWLGASIEAYGVPTETLSTVSFALRWHGARPAVLWEQSGSAVELTAPVMAPDWSTLDGSGEALWPVPPGAPVASDEPPSFS